MMRPLAVFRVGLPPLGQVGVFQRLGRDRIWLAPTAAVVAIQFFFWIGLYARGFAPAPMIGIYAVPLPFAILAAWLVRKAKMPDLLTMILGGEMITACWALLTANKIGIDLAFPFWADAPIARMEHALFGIDPTVALRAALHPALHAIEVLYYAWVPVQFVAIYALLLSSYSRRKAQGILSWALCWIVLGNFVAAILSSAGPVFYDRLYGVHRFGDSPAATMAVANMLWSTFQAHSSMVGTGISAAPSLHVAMSVWLALTLRGTRLYVPAAMYSAAIFIGSITLGWHYVTDGVLGGLGALVLWRVAGYTIDAVELLLQPAQEQLA
jgi:hypothetical protein